MNTLKECYSTISYYRSPKQLSVLLPILKDASRTHHEEVAHMCPVCPNTRLDIRLDENNQPKPGEEPINAIDQSAYIHDLAYQKSDNISDRHEADVQMINGLKQLKNLSIPQRLIRAMIIKLFQAKLKIGVGLSRAAKTQAIENILKNLRKF